MLSYKLAKQLKDTGFPQKHTFIPRGHAVPGICICGAVDENDVHIPTLSELIEACGGMFRTVGRDRMENGSSWSDDNKIEKWEAVGWKEDPSIFSRDFGEYSAYGITPEEAVSNLWLKLKQAKVV